MHSPGRTRAHISTRADACTAASTRTHAPAARCSTRPRSPWHRRQGGGGQCRSHSLGTHGAPGPKEGPTSVWLPKYLAPKKAHLSKCTWALQRLAPLFPPGFWKPQCKENPPPCTGGRPWFLFCESLGFPGGFPGREEADGEGVPSPPRRQPDSTTKGIIHIPDSKGCLFANLFKYLTS